MQNKTIPSLSKSSFCDFQDESGRTLMEMLGILAVIGIITVIGVKLFNSAMIQHQANEVIQEANKRAIAVATQIMAGRDKSTLSIDEFQNPQNYTFGIQANPTHTDRFNITIDAVDTNVCKRIKTMVGPSTVLRAISADCTILTFNDDLSREALASDYDLNQSACNSQGYKWCSNGDDGIGNKCLEGVTDCCTSITYDAQCQTCAPTTGAISNKANTVDCHFNNDATKPSKCYAGRCLDPSINPNGTTTACLTNADCGGEGSGYYCKYPQLSASVCTDDGATAMGCTGQTHLANCGDGVTAGTCTKIGVIKKFNVKGLGQVIDGATIANWWSAKNLCEALGKQLIDIDTFQVYENGTDIQMVTGYWHYIGYDQTWGCTKGKTCGKWSASPYNAMWQGTTGEAQRILTHARDENGELYQSKYSPILVALAEQVRGIGGGAYWTSSQHTSKCASYYVRTLDGKVYVADRKDTSHFNSLYPLCR